nr:ribosomal protein S2 [Navicula sp.]
MKLANCKNYKQQIAHLQTLKLSYQKESFNLKYESIMTKTLLNRILMIIFEFHASNKKILFIGFPKQFDKILKNTKHLSIPELVSNKIWESKKSNVKNTKLSKNIAKLTQKLEKKADLIVIHVSANDELLIRKSYLTYIPVITLGKQLQIINEPQDYDFPIQKSANLRIFFSLLENLPNIEIREEKEESLL